METMETMDLLAHLQRLRPNLDPSAFSCDPERLLQMKVNQINSTPGDLTGYDCPLCMNRGNTARAEDGRIISTLCSCYTIRRTLGKMARSGLKDVLNTYTFGKFQEQESWQTTAKELAQQYAAEPEGWFFACGQSGSGKSHLCTAIARKLLQSGKDLMYMPWREDAGTLKAMSLDSPGRAEKLKELKEVEVLYIDDLFKTAAGTGTRAMPSQGDIMLAFEIINYRYMAGLPTIVSTELYPEELMAIDEAIAGRIMERAKGNTLRIKRDIHRNYRLRDIVEI